MTKTKSGMGGEQFRNADGTFNMRPETQVLDKPATPAAPKVGKNGALLAPDNNSPILGVGDKVDDGRFTVVALVGQGAFGQVYTAEDKEQAGTTVIIKTGLRVREKDTARMIVEIEVMHKLHVLKDKHSPQLYACGQVLEHATPYNYMVMQQLSKSLADARRYAPLERFTLSTSIRLWTQMIASLRQMHNLGYIHRDIKPANMAMGLDERAGNFVLFDFGLARRHNDYADPRRVRKARECVGFRGTQRYVSPNVHDRREQCRADDMIGMFYSFYEVCEGTVPWSRARSDAETRRLKLGLTLGKDYPAPLTQTLQELYSMQYEQQPRYDQLTEWSAEALKAVGGAETDPFDWDTVDWKSCHDEKRKAKPPKRR